MGRQLGADEAASSHHPPPLLRALSEQLAHYKLMLRPDITACELEQQQRTGEAAWAAACGTGDGRRRAPPPQTAPSHGHLKCRCGVGHRAARHDQLASARYAAATQQ